MFRRITLLTLLLLLVGAAFTNPDRNQHITVFEQLFDDQVRENLREESLLTRGLGMLAGNAAAGLLAETSLYYESYGLFSLSRVKTGGEEHLAGIGLFGRVFARSSAIDRLLTGQ